MIVVTGSIRMLEGDEVRAAMIEASSAMLAGSQAEPGCHFYRYGFDMEDPSVILFQEAYDDMDALRAHIGSPHMAAFREATMPLVAGRPEMTVVDGEPATFG